MTTTWDYMHYSYEIIGKYMYIISLIAPGEDNVG